MDIESSHLEIMDMERMVQFYLLTHETSHSNLFIYKKEKKKRTTWKGNCKLEWKATGGMAQKFYTSSRQKKHDVQLYIKF